MENLSQSVRCVDIPRTRNAFGNSHITPAGTDVESGLERFWISCWNHASGCVGALLRADGEAKIFRFDPEQGEFGFYGAQYGGSDDLWLCGFLDEVVHMDLNTGERVHYSTGLPHDLCSAGMRLDAASGKLFASTYCQGDLTRKAFVFDIHQKKVTKVWQDLPLETNQLRHCVPLKDGRYLFVYCVPGVELIVWDPADDSLEVVFREVPSSEFLTLLDMVQREDGRVYIPRHGWFDPVSRSFSSDPLAPVEATWFSIQGDMVYGVEDVHDNAILRAWNLRENTVSTMYEIPNGNCYSGVQLKDGRFLLMGRFCHPAIFDPETRSLSYCRSLAMESVGALDCIYRVNEKSLIATPFLSQRFLKIDLETGRGSDMGRANNGGGEVLQITGLNGKIYIASYTEGQLSEYDPAQAMGYPENPMVVAMPGHHAMRPVAMCHDERRIFYANSREYGQTGSVLVSYDTQNGGHLSKVNTAGDRILRTMFWNRRERCLLAGSTCEADCRSAKPKESICLFVKIDPETLCVTARCEAPEGTYFAAILGALDEENYLVSCVSEQAHRADLQLDGKAWKKLFVLNSRSMELVECSMELDTPCTLADVFYAEKEGYFVLRKGDAFSLARWERGFVTLQEITVCPNCSKVHVQDGLLYLAAGEKIYIHTLEMPGKI